MKKSLTDNQINAILFTTLSFLWSFTWFFGIFQIHNTLLPEIAAFYRFFFASLLIFSFCLFKGYKLIPSPKELKVLVIYSLFSSSINFILFYYAAFYIVTGLSAVIFSFSIILSTFIGRYCFKTKHSVDIKTILSILVGIVGLFLLFFPQFKFVSSKFNLFIGAVLGGLATLSFSVGSTYFESKKLSLKLPVSFCIFSFFGSLWCLFFGVIHIAFFKGSGSFVPNFSYQFVLSFIYMSFISTGIGYLCFFILISRVGSVKASYTTIISPVLAVLTSALFEGYYFTKESFIGLLLIVCSKLLLFYGKKKG